MRVDDGNSQSEHRERRASSRRFQIRAQRHFHSRGAARIVLPADGSPPLSVPRVPTVAERLLGEGREFAGFRPCADGIEGAAFHKAVQRLEQPRCSHGHAIESRAGHEEGESAPEESFEIAALLLHGVAAILEQMMMEVYLYRTRLRAGAAE